MSETIDYAEMLEIPVSTLNVTKKRSKKKREPEADLKERVVETVNERMEGETEEERTAVEENVTDYGDAYVPEHAPRKKFLDSKVLVIEFIAVLALCATILLTNLLWADSAINTFFRGLVSEEETVNAPDERVYSELTLGSVVSDADIQCSVSDTGVLTFTGACSVYSPYGGTIKNVAENNGNYTVEIEHTTSFSTVIAGLTNVYVAAGDTAFSTLPVGYSAGETPVTVSMYDSGTLITSYTVGENNDIVWSV